MKPLPPQGLDTFEEKKLYITYVERPVQKSSYVYLTLIIVAIVSICCIAIWPLWLKLFVWWALFLLLCSIVFLNNLDSLHFPKSSSLFHMLFIWLRRVDIPLLPVWRDFFYWLFEGSDWNLQTWRLLVGGPLSTDYGHCLFLSFFLLVPQPWSHSLGCWLG